MGDLETSKSSGLQTAAMVVCDNPCFLTGLQIYTNATNAVTVTVYDSATASTIGKVLFKGIDNAVATSNGWSSRTWAFPVECKEGLYATISGTNGEYVVEYMEA